MENKAYYAVIPANVRYDKDLPPNAKLLYGEITALCNEKGFCWARNGYFAELYDVSSFTISRWIKALADKGYIVITMIPKNDHTNEVIRKLSLNGIPLTVSAKGIDKKANTPLTVSAKGVDEKSNPPPQKAQGGLTKNASPHHKKRKENITSNNTVNNKKNNTSNSYTPYNPPEGGWAGAPECSAEFALALKSFEEHRKKLHKPMTDRAKELLLAKLSKLGRTEQEQIAILNQSILNGWQGVFPLGGEKKQSYNRPTAADMAEQAKQLLREKRGVDNDGTGTGNDNGNANSRPAWFSCQ